MKTFITLAALAVGSNALVGRSDSCCFHLTSSGGASGELGQLDDGQNRIGDNSLSPAQYCIDAKGAITDAKGRGCILTPPTTQLQCDEGASPTPGFSINAQGQLEFNGSTDFVACATGQNGGLNVYTTPNKADVTGCVNVELSTDSCSNNGAGSGSGGSSSSGPSPSGPQSTPVGSGGSGEGSGSTPTPSGGGSTPSGGGSGSPQPSSPGSGSGSGSGTSVPAPSGGGGGGSQPSSPASGSGEGSGSSPSDGGSGEQPAPSASMPAPSGGGGSPPSQSGGGGGSQPSGSASVPAPSGGGSGSQPSGSGSASVPASSASSTPSSTTDSCPTTLTTGSYETPHLIIPVDSESPDSAAGTSFNGTVSSSISSAFNFDIPSSDAGKTCSLVFLFPELHDLETSSFSFSGDGKIDFAQLSSAVDESTTFSSLPSVSKDFGDITVSPGNSYVVSTFACPAGQTVAYELKASSGTDLNFFQDWNPSPLGLFITTC
ncbi:uncharacterized protein N7506_000903 [Penicillium brevicompactum]|uniref:uncharacterized protein n=1 Tax=Penicillium brevicompactum TaxID=5074 RepID=UPI0025410D55|nr:uncharacterized protein N7506_000903 [Penicillium brevicompactum]KAJ5347650.1 hypothetical protein N7506_000903 [Penicillium brevicompactum]